jgi:hypothetical protein
MAAEGRTRSLAVAFILLIALACRLNNLGFGLPSLYDPDEPLFMVKAAGLLTRRTLDPHWFGHPATTTIYWTALVQAAVFAWGFVTGRYASISDFVSAAYADPSIIFVPVRITMAVAGTICVGLTYLLGKRLFGSSVGLLAAALLAVNSLHIGWSQVVRSDVQASAFMLAVLLVSCRIAETGERRAVVWAGVLTGFAIATKWPAATVFAGVIGAIIYWARNNGGRPRDAAAKLALAGFATVAGLFLASPFIFIDYPTVLANLSGEARPFHVGHTGNGFLSDLMVYLGDFAAGSMGWVALVLAVAGAPLAFVRSQRARYMLLPATILFFISICAQHLIWSRWLIPGLPYLTIFAAYAVFELAELASRGRRFRRQAVAAAVGGLAILGSASGAVGQAREREHDTRAEAARWIVDHAPRGSTIVLEHPELKLRDQPLRFLFPIGRRGCEDGRHLLESGIGYDDLEVARAGSPVVDLGTVARDRLASCRADYAILTYYDLYIKEAGRFPNEVKNYRELLAGGRTVALFRPEPGEIGGPIVRIVAMPSQSHDF